MIKKPFPTRFSMVYGRFVLGIILMLVLTDLPLRSQDSVKYQHERFSVNLGGFLASMNSDISLGGQSGLGVNLNLEEALGLSTSNFVVRGEADYNFGSKRRSYLRMGYFGLFRSASKTLESELEIGNTVYPIGTKVDSKYNMQIFRAMYDYAYFKDERIMLGVSAGLYVLPMNFSIGTSYVIDESAKLIAPLPVFGFRNTFFITPKVLLKQNIEFLYVKTASIKGLISDLNMWVEYNPFKHFGFGLGLNTFRFNFTAYESIGQRDFQGTIGTGFIGLLFYGKYYF